MTIIAVISPKGGVGKTAMTVNVSVAMAASGNSVVVVDLDPQNAVGLCLGLPPGDVSGCMRQSVLKQAWQDVLHRSASGLDYLPYGVINEHDRVDLEWQLENQPDWLKQQLQQLSLAKFQEQAGLIFIDTPSGSTVYMQQVLACADIVLVVVQADAGSYAAIPQMESVLAYYAVSCAHSVNSYYVVNQMDGSKMLNRDILDALRQQLGERFLPLTVHYDQAVSDAFALQQSVLQYAHYAQSAYDFRQVAGWLSENIKKNHPLSNFLVPQAQSQGMQLLSSQQDSQLHHPIPELS